MTNKPRLVKPKYLSNRERYCVLIAAHFAVGTRNKARQIIESARSNRLPERLFSELFLHLSLLLGYPSMLEGLAVLRSVFPKTKRPHRMTPSTGLVKRRGLRSLNRIYGSALDRLLINLDSLHDEIPDVIVREVYGKIISRPGLSLREREIVNVAVLSIQHLDEQLYSHIRGALRLHVSETTLRIVIQSASKIGHSDPRVPLELLSSLVHPRRSIP